MIQKPIKKRFTSNPLTVAETTNSTVSTNSPSLSKFKPNEKIEDTIEYYSHIENYSKEEFEEGVQAHKWYLETLLNIGSENEVREFMANYAKISYSFLVEEAVKQLEHNLTLKLDRICAFVDYLDIKHDYQLDNTFRLFNPEQAIAIGEYEDYLIIASEKHCHVIDSKKIPLDKIHSLFTNGKVNVFYKAEKTLQSLRNKKILITNNIFDVTSAYKLLWGNSMTEEEIDRKIDEQLGNLSDKDKAVKKTQYLLKVRLELRQEIINKKMVEKAKQLFKSISESFTLSNDIFDLATKLRKSFEGEIAYVEKIPVLS